MRDDVIPATHNGQYCPLSDAVLNEIYLPDFHYHIVIFKKNTAYVIQIELKMNKGNK